MNFADSIRKVEPTPKRGIEQVKLEMIQRLVERAEDLVKAHIRGAATEGRKRISGVLGLRSDMSGCPDFTIHEVDEISLDDVELFRVDRFIIKIGNMEGTFETICNGKSNVSPNGKYEKYVVYSQEDLKYLCSSIGEKIYDLGFQTYSVTTVERTFYRAEMVKGLFGNYKKKRHPSTTGRVLKIEVSW